MTLPPGWTSLEIAKMLVAIASPAVVVILGVRVQQSLRRIEQSQWTNRLIIEKRLQLYEDTAPLLNDILCFFLYVGNWKELTPPAIIASKRRLDKTFHLAAPLFTPDLVTRYKTFMKYCFQTYNKVGEDAKLRTGTTDRRPYSRTPWDPSWDAMFAAEDAKSDPAELVTAYDDLMQTFAAELGLGVPRPVRLLAQRPAVAPARPQDLLRHNTKPPVPR